MKEKGFGATARQESASGDARCPRRVAWVLVLVLVAMTLGGIELALRAGLIWKVPLDYLLQRPGDRYTRTAWLIHHPPTPGPHDVIVLGSSTAAAVSELPKGESEHTLRTLTGVKDLRLISLTGSGGCYPEHLTILENALAQGYRPHTVLLLSYPSCLGAYDETDALVARRMPMVSEALASLTSRDLTTEVRISAWLARTSVLHRYRGAANAWLRERWDEFLKGRAYPWEAIVFAGDRYVSTWNGRLAGPAYRSVQTMGGSWRYTLKSAALLSGLLATARRAGARVLVIESPCHLQSSMCWRRTGKPTSTR